MRRQLTIVVAVARNGVIGCNGSLPWPRIPDDMRWFRRSTLGHAVVMGRRTWDSLPCGSRPLQDRSNVVITRNERAVHPGAVTALNVEAALNAAWSIDPDPRVIGGAQIYEQVLPMATRILLTEVDCTPVGDAVFAFDRAVFKEISRVPSSDSKITFVTLVR